jgi:hypothetical protein
MRYVLPIKKLFVFSQWSRKSYAIFASLGKLIKIGKVSAEISDNLLTKSTSLNRSLSQILSFKKKIAKLLEELRQSEGIPDPLITRLELFLRSFVLFTSVQKEAKPVCLVPYNSQKRLSKKYRLIVELVETIRGNQSIATSTSSVSSTFGTASFFMLKT